MSRLYIYASCSRIPWVSMPQLSFHFNLFQKYMHTYLNLNCYEKQERTLGIRYPEGSSVFDSRRHLAWRHLLHEHALTIDFVDVDGIQVS